MFPTDVPVDRPSVGAMGLALGSEMPSNEEQFKPYVFGASPKELRPVTDIVTDTLIEWKQPKRKAKPRLAQNKKKPKPKRKRYTYEQWVYTPPPPEPEPKFPTDIEPLPPRPPRPLRPAPGWEPTSGDDIAAILNEIGETDDRDKEASEEPGRADTGPTDHVGPLRVSGNRPPRSLSREMRARRRRRAQQADRPVPPMSVRVPPRR